MLPPLFPSEHTEIKEPTPVAKNEATEAKAVAPSGPQSKSLHSSAWVLGALGLTVFSIFAFLGLGVITSGDQSVAANSRSGPGAQDGQVYGSWTDIPHNAAPTSHIFDATTLSQKLQAVISQQSGTQIGVVVAPVGHGSQVRINDDEAFIAASTTKILTAAAILSGVDDGKYKLDQVAYQLKPSPTPEPKDDGSDTKDKSQKTPEKSTEHTNEAKPTPTPTPKPVTFEQALQLMVNRSNNTAWEQLIHLYGSRNLATFAKELGMQDYQVTSNHASPRDLAILLQKIYSRHVLSDTSTEYLLSLMQNTNEERMLPAGLSNVGPIYHKYGWIGGSVHDVGVVNNNGQPVVVVLMSTGSDSYDARTKVLVNMAKIVEQALIEGR